MGIMNGANVGIGKYIGMSMIPSLIGNSEYAVLGLSFPRSTPNMNPFPQRILELTLCFPVSKSHRRDSPRFPHGLLLPTSRVT